MFCELTRSSSLDEDRYTTDSNEYQPAWARVTHQTKAETDPSLGVLEYFSGWIFSKFEPDHKETYSGLQGRLYHEDNRGELINLFVFCQPITDEYCGQLTNEIEYL